MVCGAVRVRRRPPDAAHHGGLRAAREPRGARARRPRGPDSRHAEGRADLSPERRRRVRQRRLLADRDSARRARDPGTGRALLIPGEVQARPWSRPFHGLVPRARRRPGLPGHSGARRRDVLLPVGHAEVPGIRDHDGLRRAGRDLRFGAASRSAAPAAASSAEGAPGRDSSAARSATGAAAAAAAATGAAASSEAPGYSSATAAASSSATTTASTASSAAAPSASASTASGAAAASSSARAAGAAALLAQLPAHFLLTPVGRA